MSRYSNPVPQALDSNGSPITGAKLYFYSPGTTTTKTIYSDSALSTATTNPLISVAGGYFPDCFLDGTYKVVLKDSSDVEIWSRDPVGDVSAGQFDSWLSSNTYSTNDIVKGSDNSYYISLIDSNQGNDPTSSPTDWSLYEITGISNFAGQFFCHQQATANMTVLIDAGYIQTGISLVNVAQQSSTTITAPSTNPRIDRIVVSNTTGAYSIITGTEAASPVAPAITEGTIAVAQIALATTTTAITDSLITDERPFNTFSNVKMVTAYGGTAASDGPNTWTKLADITMPSTANDGIVLELLVASDYTIYDQGSARVLVKLVQTTSFDTTNSHIDVIEIYNNSNTGLSQSSFKVISDSTALGSTVQLWMQKLGNYGKWNIVGLSRMAGGSDSSIVYNDVSAWQSATPTGSAVNITSLGTYYSSEPSLLVNVSSVSATWTSVVVPSAVGAKYIKIRYFISSYNTTGTDEITSLYVRTTGSGLSTSSGITEIARSRNTTNTATGNLYAQAAGDAEVVVDANGSFDWRASGTSLTTTIGLLSVHF